MPSDLAECFVKVSKDSGLVLAAGRAVMQHLIAIHEAANTSSDRFELANMQERAWC
jgi:hypothetical protein